MTLFFPLHPSPTHFTRYRVTAASVARNARASTGDWSFGVLLRPGGTMAVTVPAWLPEKVCWMLSDDFHAPAVPGGHVRAGG